MIEVVLLIEIGQRMLATLGLIARHRRLAAYLGPPQPSEVVWAD